MTRKDARELRNSRSFVMEVDGLIRNNVTIVFFKGTTGHYPIEI